MGFGDKFKRPAAATKPANAPAGKRRSKYGGVKANTPQDPMPFPGLYRFRVLECAEGQNPGKGTDSFKTKLEIVAFEGPEVIDAVGDEVFVGWVTSGKGGPSGLGRVKAFVIGTAGYDDEAEYDEFDPDGEFIDACVGSRNDYSEAGLTIIGRLVDCEVTRGNPVIDSKTNEVKTGRDGKPDFYREYAWAPVEDDGQTKIVVPT